MLFSGGSFSGKWKVNVPYDTAKPEDHPTLPLSQEPWPYASPDALFDAFLGGPFSGCGKWKSKYICDTAKPGSCPVFFPESFFWTCLWFLSQTSVRHIVVIFFMVVVFNCPFVWICWILTLGWTQDKWMNKKQMGSMCRNTCHSDFEASLGDTLVGMELDCHCLLLWSQLEIFRNGAAAQPDL